MPKLVQTGSPQSWNSVQAKNIQIPSLKITLLDQHFKKLEAVSELLLQLIVCPCYEFVRETVELKFNSDIDLYTYVCILRPAVCTLILC